MELFCLPDQDTRPTVCVEGQQGMLRHLVPPLVFLVAALLNTGLLPARTVGNVSDKIKIQQYP